MDEPLTDPLDVSKEPELIKEAQKSLAKTDVLVCGGCHEVFFFVEELQKHKSSNTCAGKSLLRCENEEKSQIWGFTLWKTKQARIHREKGEEVPTSWEIYQRWTKLEQSEKDLWITAGRTLQFCNKISSAKVKEVPVKEKDPLALDDGIENGNGSKKALRTTNDNEKQEYNVEKIVGKRFNPRKRIWEYEVKWENYNSETWEPVSHLENCKALVQEYESKVKAEKEKEKEKMPTPRGRGRPRLTPGSPTAVKLVPKKPSLPPTAVVLTSPGGRPQRSSKQKALNQVKAWCGNISDGEEGGGKRSFDDDFDSDDSFEKKMKFEGESEDTEDEELKSPPKKVAKIIHTYNNGAGRKLPDNVLIPDAKGVVRISQKQLPSLSSGVYIMSKSSGIIKLDPTASKIATSGGQAIVKVSPKVGQTQIRIIKKEDGSKRVVQVKGPDVAQQIKTPTAKIVQHIISKAPLLKKEGDKIVRKVDAVPKLPPPIKITPVKEKEVKTSVRNDDDSDDGIEELEFPTDLPLPEPESPPGDFTLDPFTGKVAGQEYPEPELVVKEPKKETPTETIDNIVKLAAADITEEDLKPDVETTSAATTTTTVPATKPAVTVAPSAPSAPAKDHPPFAVVTEVKSSPSILNAAMTNSNILQKTLQSPRPKTQPRIINQTVAKPRTPVSSLMRAAAPRQQMVRPRPPVLPKPKFNIASPVATPVRSVYSKTNNVAKKVGNTTVYKTKPQTQTPQILKKSPMAKAPVAKTPIAPKPVISMPSLDEEPAMVLATPKVTQVTQVVTETPATVEADLSTFTLATGDRPMFITGDDGTVYQVAGQNEEGQTILVTQDSDGQQQCLLVTNEAIPAEELEQVETPAEMLMEVQEPVEVGEEQPLVAQFIRTEPLSPGGTHKVVVMLPDGDVMVTQVTPEEYASLELDK